MCGGQVTTAADDGEMVRCACGVDLIVINDADCDEGRWRDTSFLVRGSVRAPRKLRVPPEMASILVPEAEK
jgi:hypothetical protein